MRFRYHGGRVIASHLVPVQPVARSDLAAPMLIRDDLDYVWNPANGERYTSKRAYQKAVRRSGCEIVGNETQRQTPKDFTPSDVEADVKKSLEQLGA